MCVLQLWRYGYVIFNFSRKFYDLTKNCVGLATCVSILGTQRSVSVLGIQHVFVFWTYIVCLIFGHTCFKFGHISRVSFLGI